MPDELLRYVEGPAPYSVWWLVGGLLGVVAAVGWAVGVWVWTLPAERLRTVRITRGLHARVLRHRYARRVRAVLTRCGDGRLDGGEAAAALSAVLRSFVAQSTGVPAHTSYPGALTGGSAAAAPLLAALADARFNDASTVDVRRTGVAVEELIRQWS